METPFLTLVELSQPIPAAKRDRKLNGISVFETWVPFTTALVVEDKVHIPASDLGCPYQLVLEKDGTPKVSKAGKPMFRMAASIREVSKVAMFNIEHQLRATAHAVAKSKAERWAEVQTQAKDAGDQVRHRESESLRLYVEALNAQEQAGQAESPLAIVGTKAA